MDKQKNYASVVTVIIDKNIIWTSQNVLGYDIYIKWNNRFDCSQKVFSVFK